MMDNIINVTNNFSPWQIAATLMASIGAFFLVAGYVRYKFFQLLKDWHISQMEMNNELAIKQDELNKKLDSLKKSQDDLQDCIHNIPGHPENPNTQEQG